MKTIEERAGEYVDEGPESAFTDPDMAAYLKKAYLAGAKAALEMAAMELDAEAERWRVSKTKLMPIETSTTLVEAHDRFYNYIENAVRLAKRIRALLPKES